MTRSLGYDPLDCAATDFLVSRRVTYLSTKSFLRNSMIETINLIIYEFALYFNSLNWLYSLLTVSNSFISYEHLSDNPDFLVYYSILRESNISSVLFVICFKLLVIPMAMLSFDPTYNFSILAKSDFIESWSFFMLFICLSTDCFTPSNFPYQNLRIS